MSECDFAPSVVVQLFVSSRIADRFRALCISSALAAEVFLIPCESLDGLRPLPVSPYSSQDCILTASGTLDAGVS